MIDRHLGRSDYLILGSVIVLELSLGESVIHSGPGQNRKISISAERRRQSGQKDQSRRLSKVMYGSNMQTTSGCFIRGRIIGKLEEGRSVTNVAAEFGIAHSIVSRLWRQFQTTGTAIRGFVVVVHEEPHPQMTGTLSYRPEETGGRQRREIARHTTQATGRPISRFTVARRLLGGGLFARRPMRSRFSLSSDSHRILIWRERGSRNHPSNIIERDRYGGRGVLVWGEHHAW
ncbi:transposable element Tc1 transposase [Trichonephila clavipes]|nr:transposable element Tc1 transposase [Trichonephila clavipes]